MTNLLDEYISKYSPQTPEDYKNALKEIVQEIALYGLSKSDFFQYAAFYGGTSLRIFYGLDRFSEDMDFSLEVPNKAFQLEKYCPYIKEALLSFGLDMEVSRKIKSRDTDIQSAFVKGETLMHLITVFNQDESVFSPIKNDEKVKIKIEVDTNPPEGATFDIQYGLKPVPYMVRLYDKPSLFAGKIHAILCRNWKNRIKGRDLYDFIWYISLNTPVNLHHLQKRLEQSGRWDANNIMTLDALKKLLVHKFAEIDYDNAKIDVRAFIKDDSKLSLWSKEFFCAITQKL